ncbi:ATP-binding protein [Paenibacillus chitinolyticus]|uniref:ATP-binding protein n=1 Tax=Paenibacillus chitinolyticus TaxID=79263 RepID=UPI002DB997B5|nr:ATP-binding protein [Paenibacillus chitinolyticus]MEC0245130.1 ATP-binding protein [Paenibacillus chitinolyticus]
MTKRKTVLITGSFLIALLLIRIIWALLLAPPDHPRAVRGELDLRGFDFTEDRTVALDGDWEFYPGKFVMQSGSDAISSGEGRMLIQVPGKWDSSISAHNSPYGYGSYRLRVKVNPDNELIYGIRVSNVRTSAELYVNNRLVAGEGQPAKNKQQYTARSMPYTAAFRADTGEIDIVVQAANYDNSNKGGLVESIRFGSERAIDKEVGFSVNMQVVVCIVLLIHALYALILYAIGTRQKALIYFFMLVVSAIAMTLLDDDKLLLVWLPAINYEWSIKLILLSFIGVGAFLLQLAKNLLPEHAKNSVFRWFPVLCAIAALSVVLLPARFALGGLTVYYTLDLLACLYFLTFSLRTVLKSDKDAIYLVVGLICVLTNIIGGYLKGLLGTGYYPIDLIVAFLAFASFWFKRYFRHSDQTAKLAQKLQKADKLKDDFLANTSHELRNPLHGILNIAQTVLDTGMKDQDGKSRENMQLLISVGKRMSYMLNDLLDMTRLQENGIRLHIGSVRVQGVASGVADMLRFMTEGKPIRIVNDIPANFPTIMADENRLTQILFNLLHNAVKYTDQGEITIKAEVKDGKAKMFIADTGIGIDLETQQRMFAPYEQGDSGITAPGGGLGLGLSICKQLVELHGSTLEVDSIPGQGSVFSFTLQLSDSSIVQCDTAMIAPVSTVYAEAAVSDSSEPRDGISMPESTMGSDRPNLLVIDDDAVNLNILSSLLTSEKYNVVTAASGRDAIAILDTKDWDLIITDIMMPNMSGYELSRFVRERFSVSELPILLLTARSRPEDMDTGFLSGANDYVTKPVDAMELKSRVRALTQLKQSVREKLRMEAAWLQAQIQPHFLYNTLNSIAALSEIDNDKMSALLEAFGHYLRASFDFRNLERLVPLEHELGLVRSYLYIEKERFDDRLDIRWEVDVRSHVQVPPLSIQPLVENAIRHGLLSREEGGKIHIRITAKENEAEISVADNGIGMDEEKVRRVLDSRLDAKAGIGLYNTDRRLKQLYGKGLQIWSLPNQGTTVSFIVPK